MASFILKGLVTNDGIDRLRNGNKRRRRSLRSLAVFKRGNHDNKAQSREEPGREINRQATQAIAVVYA